MLDAIRFACALLVVTAGWASAQQFDELRVGQWVELKGELATDGAFQASSIEVLPPGDKHVLIGDVTSVDDRAGTFQMLGYTVELGDPMRWDTGFAFAALAPGKRVKVEGRYRGGLRFEAREVGPRDPGRDRIDGRIDRLDAGPENIDLEVIGSIVHLPREARLVNEGAIRELPLVEATHFDDSPRSLDDEDYVPGSIQIADGLTFGALIETKFTREDNYDLLDARDRDQRKSRLTFRPQLLWTPSDRFSALASARFEWNYRDVENRADGWSSDVRFKELWARVRDIGGTGIDLQVGRQDFDDPREWIYKKDLDAVRAVWRGGGVRVEASVSTLFGETNDPYDDEAKNGILYVSNTDLKRHVAGWIVDRRAGGDVDSYPIHFGARAIGEWIPSMRSWIEASVVRGYENDVNLRGYGFDVGTTWLLFKPIYLNFGWAFGSGDDADSSDTDESFRQTGLQRNNGKLGGVTSFRYYGEVLDPELSNLSVLTFGVGTRFTRDSSLDLVWHSYDQDTAAPFLRASDLDADPDGVHSHLGQEIDLVLGLRDWHGSDFEVAGGWFDPGSAFADQDEAWKLSLQWRFRF